MTREGTETKVDVIVRPFGSRASQADRPDRDGAGAALIERAAAGNRAAQQELLQTHIGRMRRVVGISWNAFPSIL